MQNQTVIFVFKQCVITVFVTSVTTASGTITVNISAMHQMIPVNIRMILLSDDSTLR